MFGFEELDARTNNITREGVVTEIIPERHSCRVTFSDRDNLVSAELPVLTLSAAQNKSYWMPEVGERVAVLSATNDHTGGGGYVIGSLYTSEIKPTENNADMYKLEFADRTEFSYKRQGAEDKTHRLKMALADGTEILFESDERQHNFQIKFSDGAHISYEYGDSAKFEIKFKDGSTIEHDGQSGNLEMNMRGEINIQARGEINIQSSQEINIQSSQDVNMRGSNIHLN